MDPGLSSVVSLDSTERLRNEVRWNYARCGTTSITHQLFRPHVVQDPLGVLTVVTALHDGQKQLGGVILLNRGEKVSITTRVEPNLLPYVSGTTGSRLRSERTSTTSTFETQCVVRYLCACVRAYLQLQHEVHPLLAQRVDVV